MKLKNILFSGFASGLVIFAVWMAVSMLIQLVAPYDVLALGGMRAKEDPVMLLFLLHPWVIGFALAVVYQQVAGALTGTGTQKGVKFGLLMWLVSSLPSAFIVFTSMDYPPAFTVSSVVSSLISMPLAGAATAKLMEK